MWKQYLLPSTRIGSFCGSGSHLLISLKKSAIPSGLCVQLLDKVSSNRDEVYLIWFKHEFAGLIGFKDIDRINDKIEIGYWLIEKMTGEGIATSCYAKNGELGFQEYEYESGGDSLWHWKRKKCCNSTSAWIFPRGN